MCTEYRYSTLYKQQVQVNIYIYIFCCSPVQRLGIQATKEEHHSNIVEVVANITKFVP